MEKEIFAYARLLSGSNGNTYGMVSFGEEVEMRFHWLFGSFAIFCFKKDPDIIFAICGVTNTGDRDLLSQCVIYFRGHTCFSEVEQPHR